MRYLWLVARCALDQCIKWAREEPQRVSLSPRGEEGTSASRLLLTLTFFPRVDLCARAAHDVCASTCATKQTTQDRPSVPVSESAFCNAVVLVRARASFAAPGQKQVAREATSVREGACRRCTESWPSCGLAHFPKPPLAAATLQAQRLHTLSLLVNSLKLGVVLFPLQQLPEHQLRARGLAGPRKRGI